MGRQHERGQSIVILALSLVVMLGFAGVAIDGGILYADRRNAQNAADAGALAGALAILQHNDPISIAYSRAADNDYDNNHVSNWVNVYNPPIDGPYAGNPYYVEVRIRSKVDTVFAHFVYKGQLENTVTAIARAKPATVTPFLNGDAMVGLAKSGCSVIWAHGNNTTSIDGSGIFVNSSHPDCAFKASGGNVLNVGGDINVVGGFEISGGAVVDPIPHSGAEQIDTPTIPPPSCSTTGTRNDSTGEVTPGNISDFNFSGGNYTLTHGIYCVTGGFSVNAGTTIQDDGDGVLIYVKTGDISWNGGATIKLHAMKDGEYANMLIYQDPSDTQMATINGDSGSEFYGTIFVPNAQVQINGTGAADGFHAQVVADTVDMSGTADMHIVYNPDENYAQRDPAQVELTQ